MTDEPKHLPTVRMTRSQLKRAAAIQEELEMISDAAEHISKHRDAYPPLVTICVHNDDDEEIGEPFMITKEEYAKWLAELAVGRRAALQALGVAD